MGWNASIRVMSDDGDPKSSVEVKIFFSGLIGTVTTEYTDSDGWANFDIPEVDDYTMHVDKIYIDGSNVDESISLDTGDTRSYTV